MGRLLRPGPLLGWVVLAASGLVGTPVPDLVAGVLGVAQEKPDGRAAPSGRAASGVGGDRWRETAEVAVEQVADLGQPPVAVEVLVEDQAYHRRVGRVEV